MNRRGRTSELTSARAQQYLVVRLKHKSHRETADELGITWANALWVERQPETREVLQEILYIAGISPERIGAILTNLLEATTQEEFMTKGGEIKVGQVRPDNAIRLKALQMLLQIMGFNAAGGNKTVTNNVVETHITENKTFNKVEVRQRMLSATPERLLAFMQGEMTGTPSTDIFIETAPIENNE